jgi:hypothetical protein
MTSTARSAAGTRPTGGDTQQQSTDLRSTLTTIAECPVCCEAYSVSARKPKLMTPCGHTLCLECGLSYCRHKVVSSPGDRIACPVCRRGVRLPAGGFNALPNNLTMMKLLDVRDVLVKSESQAEVRSAVDMVEGLSNCENRYAHSVELLRQHNINQTLQPITMHGWPAISDVRRQLLLMEF